MEWINYHHLLYFWVVVREGGLVQAGQKLKLSHPTLSAQIHALEHQLGQKLFSKIGRKLTLTEIGRVVFRYAEEIFSLGQEMLNSIQGHVTGPMQRLNVGIVEAVPKLIVRRLLEPALLAPEPLRIVCYENNYEKLLTELSLHNLDIVITDAPIPPGSSIRAFNHLLGECGVGIFAAKRIAKKYRPNFPHSLHEAPMLMPIEHSPLRRALNEWFEQNQIQPSVLAEFQDSALMKVFGAEGTGLFPAPLAVEQDICKQFGVQKIGLAKGVKERFYVVSIERKIKNPAVIMLTDMARLKLFRKGLAIRTSL